MNDPSLLDGDGPGEELDEVPGLEDDVGVPGGAIQQNNFSSSFGLENHMSFLLEIPFTKKKFISG